MFVAFLGLLLCASLGLLPGIRPILAVSECIAILLGWADIAEDALVLELSRVAIWEGVATRRQSK